MTKLSVQRFQALDVFRGMTVCFMIVVNTPGSWDAVFAPLLHANWHGFTPTDLVFPSFLFAVGNALSFVSAKWDAMNRAQVLKKIFKRTAIIFLIGYLMYWFPFFSYQAGELMAIPFAETRVMGVLQRIALCYGAAALLVYFFKPKAIYVWCIALLLLYWGLAHWLAPDAATALTLQGNACLRVDMLLLGEGHLYKGEGIPFDPEGVLSTLPAIVNVLAGFLAGQFMQQKGKTYSMLRILAIVGLGLLMVAYGWHQYFPINKKLWTSSFVVLTVGLDLLLLALVIYVIDFAGFSRWTYFFEVFGKNPLFIYLLSGVLATLLWMIPAGNGKALYTWIYETVFLTTGAKTGSFLFALMIMMLCWLIGYVMDKRKWYVKV